MTSEPWSILLNVVTWGQKDSLGRIGWREWVKEGERGGITSTKGGEKRLRQGN